MRSTSGKRKDTRDPRKSTVMDLSSTISVAFVRHVVYRCVEEDTSFGKPKLRTASTRANTPAAPSKLESRHPSLKSCAISPRLRHSSNSSTGCAPQTPPSLDLHSTPLKYRSLGHAGATVSPQMLFARPPLQSMDGFGFVLKKCLAETGSASCTKAFKRGSPRALPNW